MEWRIPFNKPALVGTESGEVQQVFAQGKFAGGGTFNKACNRWLRDHLDASGVLITTSCTHALEMAALLCDLQPQDEVILPSYAFTSTATAFARCGAKLVFVDCEAATMNLDANAVAAAITPRSKVIVALHYAGVSCDMRALRALADEHGLKIVEDAAQALFASYDGKPCGTLGDYGCFSFHETKNMHCGEGGALVLNRPEDVQKAEVLLEKGTNRMQFFRGETSRYEWVGMGSSYVPSELNAAFLLAQLKAGAQITQARLASWQSYERLLRPLEEAGHVALPNPPRDCQHNAHIFWIKLAGKPERDAMIAHLKAQGIAAVFHYIPLHSAPAGRVYGTFHGEDINTTRESERLLRLPLYYAITQEEIAEVVHAVTAFFALTGETHSAVG
ncbi:dTDP-4-amino-4,6-dideoxygalactose transaminase [Roseobacter denitrificans]|uniref:DegT/DnrJ/EryC1/StrS aminotransferase family n=1 Tax=Roseobacter denitrificans (strain ATCC 33942 / OCh 114) TaxID=375451 RepID=Q16CM0_ROSDO|nr:dTDP-4-amino-4,6-dideoxygalactose transaminase [Roseobacter denitrificans]ABG30273.1 DegT/DnrJ/EryC1/StrS aminotransferase family [Roseobacter denitrificans OCh 114]SFF71151.1 dTDP-4-amino-4,6-dideoxygalactose transaminase [Roseobacter denitrificans OCh 114]